MDIFCVYCIKNVRKSLRFQKVQATSTFSFQFRDKLDDGYVLVETCSRL